jgi:hypothetical protein
MAKTLSQYVQNQISSQNIKVRFVLTINGTDKSDYLRSWSISNSKEFGSAQATFILNNDEGIFGENGQYKINIGDVVSFAEYYGTDSTSFPRFYGVVQQRPITKSAAERAITLVCLDYIATLQYLDIDLKVEGEKIKVEDETLTPNYLPSPNDSLAQVFNFANDSIADNPLPLIMIRNKNTAEEDPQYDGFEILYDNGQIKLGSVLNAKDNYDLVATTYYTYVHGVYVEDVLEEIFTLPDSYNNYLFGETSSQNVINNHLIDTFYNVEGTNTDYLIPNYTSTQITIETTLISACIEGTSSITLTSVSGLPSAGQGSINGDIFTWSSIVGSNLEGIPTSGEYSLKTHAVGSYFEYTNTYSAGQVWYLKYSNLVSSLTGSDFTIPGGTFKYLDSRYGRIILTSAISLSATVKCNTSYSFKTLQASGIELNYIGFTSREVENRLEAIKKLKSYCAPNYIIRTIGDNKIWSNYVSQKTVPDYTLQLSTQLSYIEDEDLYTRVLFYVKNKNPSNLMLGEGISFVGTGQSYKALASATELSPLREETNYYIYGAGFGENAQSSGDYKNVSRYPLTAVDDSSIGTISWANPSNVFSDNLDYATASFIMAGTSHYLKITGFNFAIPINNYITGITIGIKRLASTDKGYIRDNVVKLVVGGVVLGNNYAKITEADNWSSSFENYVTYGSSSDLWGTVLTPAIVNSPDFGMVLSIQGLVPNLFSPVGTAKVNTVLITVTYSSIDTAESSSISGIGKIIANRIKPIIYINEVPVDNTSHLIAGQQVAIEVTTKTETTSSGGGK